MKKAIRQSLSLEYWVRKFLEIHRYFSPHPAYAAKEFKSHQFKLDAGRARDFLNVGNNDQLTILAICSCFWSLILQRNLDSPPLIVVPSDIFPADEKLGDTTPVFIDFPYDEGKSLRDFLQVAGQEVQQVSNHLDFDFEEFRLRMLAHDIEIDSFPLFGICLRKNAFENLTERIELVMEFEIDLTVPEELFFFIKYRSFFDAKLIKQLAGQFEMLACSIKPLLDHRVGNILLAVNENRSIIESLSNTPKTFQPTDRIEVYFRMQAKKTPSAVALYSNNRTLTYLELDDLSDRMGRYLRDRCGVKSGDLIGMRMEHSEWLIICILGILKADAAYIPLDPQLPPRQGFGNFN